MTEPTIRQRVKSIQLEVREPDLLPTRASELQNILSSLMGNVLDECREADLAYKRVLLTCMYANKAANRARIEAETSGEFVRRQEAEHTRQTCVEMIRSLRQYLRNASEEMRLTR